MNLQDLISLDGKLELYAQNGRFLGLLSSDISDPNSIINVRTYGNDHNINSIHYEHGIYGGRYGLYSPFNQCCLYPPTIVFQQQHIAIVSKNKYILDRALTIVDPDMMIAIYINLSNNIISLNSLIFVNV